MNTASCSKCGATGTTLANCCGQATQAKTSVDRAAEATVRRNETSRNSKR